MATGAWVNRRVVAGLPAAHAEAFGEFHHSAVLVANVALTNWRFLHELGMTACRWSGGFGFSCNIRRPMVVGDYRPPLDPDRPTVLTFYVPFYHPGLSVPEQGARGRMEMLGTSFADYEREIRRQMTRLFGAAGFDARRDVAGIILNRWGHAYVNPQPGFYFGRGGRPAPRDVVRERFGRIAFGHSEQEGHQNWPGATRNGVRAARQVMEGL
jgi:spermidine dehydrogenase